MNPKAKGYILGAIAAASYGMNPLFALPLYEKGMNPDSVLFFRYLIAIPILAIMMKIRGRHFRVKRQEIGPLALFGLLFSLSSLTLFQSYNYMDAGIASTLLFIYPILVALIMFFVFKEKLTKQTILCITSALIGIALLYKGENGTTLSLTGICLIFASALSYAIYIVGINQTNLKSMATLKITFYVLLFGLSLYAIRLLVSHDLHVPSSSDWYLWLNLLCLAVFPTAISLLCTTKAIQFIGSTPTAILGALEPVTAVFIGVTIFHETITPRIMLGLLLIVVSVTFVVAGGHITKHLTRFRKMFPPIGRRKKMEARQKDNN